MNDDHGKAKPIFLRAAEIAAVDERHAYLAAACGGDHALQSEVEDLLRHQQRLGSFLEGEPGGPATVAEQTQKTSGTVIGPYKLLQQIGEGGMGTVFMAQQEHPVRRKVALKVIKAGMDSRQVVARFEAERQALAMMDHVSIARVLDAGATEAGLPYFVMELVHGLPITKYCDDNHLTLRERLELFVPVCQAIQHAHQKGIIHRDVKPSNVLVTLYDGKPVPKVIDFGIAKATEQKLTERTLFTQYGTMVGTLEYMSPEQAEMSALGVDTRSDIYSLGVLLDELLTGSTPLTHKRMKEAAYAEILRMIKEEEPQKPSSRLSDSGEALASISAQRHMEPAKLTKLVRGELDWIVMKTLEKDRNRRYETASAFAADVQRYLHDEPVTACPPSAWYRFRKLARRNKRAFVSAAAAALVVMLAMVALTVGFLHVKRERDEKEAALSEKDVALREKDVALQEKDSALLAKDAALQEKEKAFREATRQKNLAQFHLGFAQVAVHDCLTSVAQNPRLKAADFHDLRRALLAPSAKILQALALNYEGDPELQGHMADVYSDLAFLRQEMGDLEQALKDYQRMRDIVARLAAKYHDKYQYRLDLARAHHCAANILCELGRRSEAEPLYKEALTLRKKVIQEGHNAPGYRNNLALTHICLGLLCSELDQQREALTHYDEALTLQQQLVKEFPKVADYREGLADTFTNRGKLFEEMSRLLDAETAGQEAITLQEKLVAEFPGRPEYRQHLATSYNNLGGVLGRLGKWPKAEKPFRDAIAIQAKLVAELPQVPQYRQELARSYANLGSLLTIMGKPADATARFRQALPIYEELRKSFPKVSEYAVELASTYSNMGHLTNTTQPDAALDWFTQAIAALEPVLAQEPKLLTARGIFFKAHWGRAETYNLLGRPAQALKDYDKAVEFASAPMRVHLRAERALILAALKEHARAREEADALAAGKDLNGRVLLYLAIVYAQSVAAAGEDAAQAERYAARAVELLRRATGVGFKDANVLKQYPQFAPLRRYKPFQELLKELETKKDGQPS